MLRSIVALLLVANLAFFAWSQGWLDNLMGVRAGGDREPERLAHQVRPETVRILTVQAVEAAASAAEAGMACLEAGPFDTEHVQAAESALATTLPAGSWVRRTTEQPARWIIYMGRYPNREAELRKEQELERLKVPFEELANVPAALDPGLSLGRFDDRDAAEAALLQLSQRGVQTGRVIELAKPAPQHMLRVERADPEFAQKVTGLKLDALGNKGFAPCAKP